MSADLDILGLLRKYEAHDKLKREAADEIERLRADLMNALHTIHNQRSLVDRYQEHLRVMRDFVAYELLKQERSRGARGYQATNVWIDEDRP